MSLFEYSFEVKWSTEYTGESIIFETSMTDGRANWSVIQAADPVGSEDILHYPAFQLCDVYGDDTYDDNWYLTAFEALQTLCSKSSVSESKIDKILDAAFLIKGVYWSSSQSAGDVEKAKALNFHNALGQTDSKKTYEKSVRLILCF